MTGTPPITYEGGPGLKYMMTGDRLACVSCHGLDAKGGKHKMHNDVMDAPDIRWSALANHHHEEASGEGKTGHGHESEKTSEEGENHHETYDFEDFKNAVENGRHPDGDKLDENMPRWKISDLDLRDLMEYLRKQ